jgi:diguanylate cyclase (GGDEF)-like protein/PAS domain S-box-containing protein
VNALVTSPLSLPNRWILRIGASTLFILFLLAGLYHRAEQVEPNSHFSYMQQLRDLREIDARIDAELLSNRLELSRNYDALTRQARDSIDIVASIQNPPSFLFPSDLEAVVRQARVLQDLGERKFDLIDRFKRDDSVLRNSLAYFPAAIADYLDRKNDPPQELRRAVNRYARSVLVFARSPDSIRLNEVHFARRQLDNLGASGAQKDWIRNLELHGDLIVKRLSSLNELLLDILKLQTSRQLETLNALYARGHANALSEAAKYRIILYLFTAILVFYLAWTFGHLYRARRSLEQAHGEISNRYAAQLAAEKRLKLHATAFLSAHDGITLTDATGKILDVNPAFSRITGYDRSEVIGRNPRVLKSGRHGPEFYQAMWQSIKENGSWRGEIWNRNKIGEVYPELLSISAVRDELSGELTNYVAVFADIRRIKAQERQLTHLAYYDALTDLPNRTLISDRLSQGLAQTRRTKTLMAICYLDLDGFKPINDTWGHEAGDKVLVETANRLQSVLRGGDTVARLGGDEFVLLLQGLTSEQECDAAVQRLLREVARPLSVLPGIVTVSASIGVALFPRDDNDADTLLRHADQAMYQAKQSGKNCAHFFDSEEDQSVRSRHDRIARIRRAMEEHEFELYYQPKVNMREGRVVGAEALIRWNHPERGVVPPIEFLPLIESDDLIKEIGDWVIESALTQMDTWEDQGLSLSVSVNVAGRQLQSAEFVEKLKVATYLHPRVARQLELEVLETAALEDVIKVSRVMDECQAMGVRFALDDFGTGYSSLTYLKRLPAETIKIDQSFVREMLSDYNNLIIVQGVLGLAQAFQRKVIAEGVETVEHGHILMQMNCDLAQGYGIAKPMPAASFTEWLKEWRPDSSWQAIREMRWEETDYSIFGAEVEYRNWVSQLINSAREGMPLSKLQLGDDDQSRFNLWIHGQACQRYASYPAFHHIVAYNARVKVVAKEMDECWREGHFEEMRTLVSELIMVRDETLDAFKALKVALSVTREGG